MESQAYIYDSVFAFFAESNYQILRNEILNDWEFIEDVFHDSFLTVRVEVIENRLTGFATIKQLFKNHYKENLKRFHSDKMKYVLFNNTILELLKIKIDYGTNYLQSY